MILKPRSSTGVIAPYYYSETEPNTSGYVTWDPQYPGFLQVAYIDNDGTDQTATVQALNIGDPISCLGQTWTITGTSFLASNANFGVTPAAGAGLPDGVYKFALGSLLPVTPSDTTAWPVTIPQNGTISSIANFNSGSTPVLLVMPDTWNPSVYATIQISLDGNTFYDILHADGTPFSTVVQPGAALLIEKLIGWASCARIRSGTFTAPTPQLQACTFTFITQP